MHWPLVLISLPVIGLLYEALAARLTHRRHPPPGRLIDVGGRRLHVHAAGEGPSVVIAPGRFNTSPMWERVQAGASRFARICVVDRAGYAWSDPAPDPRTGAAVAEELHTALHRAGHGVPVENPEAIVAAIRAHLE